MLYILTSVWSSKCWSKYTTNSQIFNLEFNLFGEHLMNAQGALVVTEEVFGNHWTKSIKIIQRQTKAKSNNVCQIHMSPITT